MAQDLERPGALDEATRTLAQLHAQSCESCGARLGQSRALMAGLRGFEASQTAAGAPARLEAILRSAFLRQKWEAARAKMMRRWAAAGIAAALLLTAGVASRYLRKPPVPRETARMERPAGPAVPEASNGQSQTTVDENSGSGPGEEEIASDFQSYPPGGAIVPFERGQIVRVAMPGSALVAMGFPIDGDRAGDRFTADVLVGEDGLPRAIRLVR